MKRKALKRAGILKVRSEGPYQYLSPAIPKVKQACALVHKALLSQMSQQSELAKAFGENY